MAYTAATTRSSGYTPTATNWNTEVVDNLNWLAVDKPTCILRLAGDQSISTATWTAVSFTDADDEVYDPLGMHSAASPTRITIPTGGGGVYALSACLQFPAAGSTGATGSRGLRITVNGVIVAYHHATGTGQSIATTMTTMAKLAAADYVIAEVYQASGSSLSLDADSGQGTMLSAVWMAVG